MTFLFFVFYNFLSQFMIHFTENSRVYVDADHIEEVPIPYAVMPCNFLYIASSDESIMNLKKVCPQLVTCNHT